MYGNLDKGLAVIMAYTPEERAEYLASVDRMVADADSVDMSLLGVDVEALTEYNVALAAAVREQLAHSCDEPAAS